MFVILCYDVQAKRVSKVMKTASKYLRAAQESVFKGFLTECRVNALKHELLRLIDPEKDSVIIYKYVPGVYFKKDEIGIRRNPDTCFL